MCGSAGIKMNAAIASRSFPHPCSVGAATTGAADGAVGATGSGPLMPLRLHPANVGNDRQVAGALDRFLQLPLMACANAAQAARQDLAVVSDEPAERAVIFVVDE